MYKKVFISHSKDDPNSDEFHKIFSGIESRGVWMEFEKYDTPPFISIREYVNSSDALFVLLSRHLVNKLHTINWVSFEVGLAANCKKKQGKMGLDVWVFDPLSENIYFPVPYCTHYMRYRTSSAFIQLMKGIVTRKSKPLGIPVDCPYMDCKVSFTYFRTPIRSNSPAHSIQCPTCRRPIEVQNYWFYKYALNKLWAND